MEEPFLFNTIPAHTCRGDYLKLVCLSVDDLIALCGWQIASLCDGAPNSTPFKEVAILYRQDYCQLGLILMLTLHS